MEYCDHPKRSPRANCKVCGKSLCSDCAILHRYEKFEILCCLECSAKKIEESIRDEVCPICGGDARYLKDLPTTNMQAINFIKEYKCRKCESIFQKLDVLVPKDAIPKKKAWWKIW
ncbi:MAG: hypothetical protein ABFC34_04965 [Methanobacterium sp.]